MDVFLSYPHANRDFAKELAKALRDEGVSVLDASQVPAGASLSTEIQHRVDQADAFVYLATDSEPGQWANREIASAVATASERNLRIIPVVLSEDAEVPIFLGNRVQLRASPEDPNALAHALRIQIEEPIAPPDWRAELRQAEAERQVLEVEMRVWESKLAIRNARISWIIGLTGVLTGVASSFAAGYLFNRFGATATGVVTAVSVAVSAAVLVTAVVTRHVRQRAGSK